MAWLYELHPIGVSHGDFGIERKADGTLRPFRGDSVVFDKLSGCDVEPVISEITMARMIWDL